MVPCSPSKRPRLVLLIALLGLVACGEGSPNDCACTVTIGEESLALGCGETGCLADRRFGCDEDNVVTLGRCSPDLAPATGDDGHGGQCLLPAGSCEGSTLSCCGVASDAGVLAPSCDPVTRRCCVPTFAACETSADCCAGHACTIIGTERRCGS